MRRHTPGSGRCWRLLLFVCGLALLGAASTSAQSDGGRIDAPASSAPVPPVLTHDAEGRVVVRATRVTEPIKVDGQLDEEVYRRVPPITEFIQQVPDPGAPVTERTEAWILFDDEQIYVVSRCWDTHPEPIVANDMRRGSSNLSRQDNLGVAFDTFHDRRNGFVFYTSPIGGMRESAVIDEKANHDWRAIWEGKTRRFEGGWNVEIALPFKSLRFGPGRQQTWGIQLRRRITSKNEMAWLTLVDPAWSTGAINHVASSGTLVGLEVPPAARNVEIRPYALSRVTTDLLSSPPFRNKVGPDAGIDVKYGVTKSFYDGSKKTAEYTGRVEVTPRLGVEPNISLNWIDLPQGRFTDTVFGGRTTFTVSPWMYVAALIQYSSSQASLSTNLRFRWEYRPGSEFFVVYTDGRSTLPPHGTDLQNRGIVLKINRLVRLCASTPTKAGRSTERCDDISQGLADAALCRTTIGLVAGAGTGAQTQRPRRGPEACPPFGTGGWPSGRGRSGPLPRLRVHVRRGEALEAEQVSGLSGHATLRTADQPRARSHVIWSVPFQPAQKFGLMT